MDIDKLRDELAHGRDPWLRKRRAIAAIAAGLAADFAIIGMGQYGVVQKLPDVPLRAFDSTVIMRSRRAYPLGFPDSTLAVIGCGAIIALATARGSSQRSRWFDLALGAGVLGGVGGAVYYLHEMLAVQKKLCAYCLVGAAGFFSLIPLAARGVLRAFRKA